MENNNRPLRNTRNCLHIANIFNPNTGTHDLLSKIPNLLKPMISTTQLISCDSIIALPQLRQPNNALAELNRIKTAALYQQKWQRELADVNLAKTENILQQKVELNKHCGWKIQDTQQKTSAEMGNIHTILPLFSAQQHLQRLNDFIMGDPCEGKTRPQSHQIIDRL